MALPETKIKHGGILKIGDFIAISRNHAIEFGWFCGRGQGNTFQYYYYRQPMWRKNIYEEAKISPKYWNHKKAISEPFTIKWITKCFVTDIPSHSNRILKIENPLDFFTEIEDLQVYEESKQILEELNFLKL